MCPQVPIGEINISNKSNILDNLENDMSQRKNATTKHQVLQAYPLVKGIRAASTPKKSPSTAAKPVQADSCVITYISETSKPWSFLTSILFHCLAKGKWLYTA